MKDGETVWQILAGGKSEVQIDLDPLIKGRSNLFRNRIADEIRVFGETKVIS